MHWQVTSLCPPTDVSIDITNCYDAYNSYNTSITLSNGVFNDNYTYTKLLLYSVMMLAYFFLSLTISVSNVTTIIICNIINMHVYNNYYAYAVPYS